MTNIDDEQRGKIKMTAINYQTFSGVKQLGAT